MLQKVINFFLEYQIKNQYISEDEKELYQYGYTLFILDILNIMILIVVGIIFKCLPYMLLFTLCYIPLRNYAGGFHADTPLKCTVLSAGVDVLIVVLLHYVSQFTFSLLFYVGVLASQAIICFKKPIPAIHKPVGEKQMKKHKKKCRIIVLAELIVMLLCIYCKLNKAVLLIGVSHMIVAVLMFVPQKKNG